MLDWIKKLDYASIEAALRSNADLANQAFALQSDDPAVAHPLHRLCDGVFNGWYSDEDGCRMAALFLAYGARIEGNHPQPNQDTPLVAAASLHADQLGLLYLSAGANVHHPGCYGGTALHWAAWCGRPILLKALIEAGAKLEQLCQQFKSTPVFWAAHGLKFAEGAKASMQGECLRLLLAAGSNPLAPNVEGHTIVDLLGEAEWETYRP